MDQKQKINLWYWVLAFVGVLLVQDLWLRSQTIKAIPYSQFEEYVVEERVDNVVIGSNRITGSFTDPQDGKTEFITTPVDPGVSEFLREHDITYTGAVQSTWLGTLLSWIVPALVFVGLWFFLIRRFAEKQGFGGFMSVGKTKAKIYVEKDTGTSFDDVAGVDEAKAELEEIVEFLKDPEGYGSLGARMPKGVLLVGPPGTGKTMLARAVAGEAGVPFFSISGSEFVEMFVGVGAARVRDLFEQARAKAPAIIFVDELDALGRARGATSGVGGHDEREQTLNQLLTELDGFDSTSGLVLLAATNRPEILDPALLRAGRFDRQVLVDRPDRAGRIAILDVHMKKVKIGRDVQPEQIAALTTGFSGADLANLVNEAALLATRRGGSHVTMEDFTNAIERIVAGLEKRNRLLNPREREIVAYHEMGHALAAMALPGVDDVHKVSIIPRGIGALGYTIQRPTEDRFLMTREELESKIAVLLGGRAAEGLVFGHLSTGASDDLARATEIARSMATRYGMNEELGSVSYEDAKRDFLGQPSPGRRIATYSDTTAELIDAAVRDTISSGHRRVFELLRSNRATLERSAQDLLEKETLTAADLEAYRKDLASRGETELAKTA